MREHKFSIAQWSSGRNRGRRLLNLIGAAAIAVGSCTSEAGGSFGDGEEGPPIPPGYWDNPLPRGVEVATAEEAATDLGFSPVVPKDLGSPKRIVVTDPQSSPLHQRIIAFVYEHDTYGTFYVSEELSEESQEGLEALAQRCSQPDSGCVGVWRLVTIRGDTTALLHYDGDNTSFITWLDKGVLFDVVGPAETFGAQEALEVAERI